MTGGRRLLEQMNYVRLNVVLTAHTEVRRVVLGYGSDKFGFAFICSFLRDIKLCGSELVLNCVVIRMYLWWNRKVEIL